MITAGCTVPPPFITQSPGPRSHGTPEIQVSRVTKASARRRPWRLISTGPYAVATPAKAFRPLRISASMTSMPDCTMESGLRTISVGEDPGSAVTCAYCGTYPATRAPSRYDPTCTSSIVKTPSAPEAPSATRPCASGVTQSDTQGIGSPVRASHAA